MNIWYKTYHAEVIGHHTYNRPFFHIAFRWAFYNQKRAHTCRCLAGLAYLFDDVGRASPRAGRRAGPPRVPSRLAGTVAEEANEKVRLESIKGKRRELGFSLLKRHDFGFAICIYNHTICTNTNPATGSSSTNFIQCSTTPFVRSYHRCSTTYSVVVYVFLLCGWRLMLVSSVNTTHTTNFNIEGL